jgi:hypothetical protein
VQVAVVPREDTIESIQQMLFFVESVRFAWIDDQLGLDAVPL